MIEESESRAGSRGPVLWIRFVLSRFFLYIRAQNYRVDNNGQTLGIADALDQPFQLHMSTRNIEIRCSGA